MKKRDFDTIIALMKNPQATDAQLAKLLGISRSAVAKRRSELLKQKRLIYYASPDLGKMTEQLISGVFKLGSAVGYKEAKKVADKFAKSEKFWTVYIRRVGPGEWGIGFVYYNEVGHREFNRLIEDWRALIKKEIGPEIAGTDISGDTYFVKMLGQPIKPEF